MHKYKRVITLVLALLMISSVFFGLFSALAAALPLVLEKTGEENCDVTGTLDTSVLKEAGKYEFTVVDDLTVTPTPTKVKLKLNLSGTDKGDVEANLSTDIKTITYGGFTFAAKSSAIWKKDDVFSVTLSPKQGVNPNPKDPVISYVKTTKYSSTSADNVRTAGRISEVTRNRDVNIFLTITDSGANEIKDPYVILESGAFKSYSEAENNGLVKPTRIDVKPSTNGSKQAIDVDIIRLTYSGKGNSISFTYGYLADGVPVEYSATVTIQECVEYIKKPEKEDPELDPKDLDPLVPHIIVDKYSYGKGQVAAGQEFPLEISFTNTSAGYDIQNIVMKVSTTDGLSLTSSSNTYYLPGLNKKQSQTKTINLQAKPNAKPESHNITITFDFQYVANEKRTAGKSEEIIAIPVTQIDRFAVNPIEAPAYLFVNEEFPLSATFVNKGRTDVYNVSAEIRGIANSGQKQFIGNVESGKENSADFFIIGKEPGPLKGEVVVTYEDANMNIKEVVMPFEAMVQGMDMPFEPGPGDGLMPPPIDEPASTEPDSKNLSLGFAGFVIAALTAFVNIKKVKQKRIGDTDEDI